MDARAKIQPDGTPTHCHYGPCEAPLQQPLVGRRRYFCCDDHRIAANQETRRRATKPSVHHAAGGRHVAYGESVLAVHQQFRAALQGLQELAGKLAAELTRVGDVRNAQAVVEQAELALAQRERELVNELNAEIQDRTVAVDDAEEAREDAAAAAQAASLAQAKQARAEAALEEAKEEFGRDRASLELQMTAARERASQSEAAAAEAAARASRAESAQAQLEQRHAVELVRLREQEAELRAELGGRISALEQLSNDLADQVRQALQQREVLEARIRALEEIAQVRSGEIHHARAELERERLAASQDRDRFEQRLAQEVERGQLRVSEARADLSARLEAIEEVARERAVTLAEYRAQLETLRTDAIG